MGRFEIIAFTVCLVAACGAPDSKNNVEPGTTPNSNTNGTSTNNLDGEMFAFDPGISTDKPTNELTDEETQTACVAAQAYYQDSGFYASECLLEGYSWAELADSMDDQVLRDACADRVEVCLAERADGRPRGHLCSTARNCTGTVAQALACDVDSADGQVSAIADLPPCDEITFADLERAYTFQLPPSPPCAQYNATCN